MTYHRIMFGDQPNPELAGDVAAPSAASALSGDQSNHYAAVLDAFMSRTAMDFTKRMGSMEAEFSRFAIVNGQNEATTLLQSEETFQMYFEVTFKSTLASPVVGFFIKDSWGRIICSTATNVFAESPLKGIHQRGSRIVVIFSLRNTLSGGRYFLGAAVSGDDGRRIDVMHDVVMFEVLPTPRIYTDCVVNMFPEVSAIRLDNEIFPAREEAEASRLDSAFSLVGIQEGPNGLGLERAVRRGGVMKTRLVGGAGRSQAMLSPWAQPMTTVHASGVIADADPITCLNLAFAQIRGNGLLITNRWRCTRRSYSDKLYKSSR